MSRTKQRNQERDEALARLHGWIKPGDTIYTILRNASRSGMQREIGIVVPLGTDFIHPNHAVAVALGYRLGKKDGVIVGGAGMDMGFHIVYSLSRAMFPAGFGCIGDKETGWRIHTEETCPSRDYHNPDNPAACEHRESWTIRAACPSNDHSNGDRDYTPHYDGTPRTSAEVGKDLKPYKHYHQDGGYALRQRWL